MVSNKELISVLHRLGQGDRKAFEQLYNSYSGVSYSFVLSLVKDTGVAKDIVQDAFVKVWLKRESISRTISFDAYLFRMLKNAVYDFYQERDINRKYVCEMVLSQEEYEELVDRKISADELQLLIFEAVNRMPERRRQIFMMSRYQNVKNVEIARQLGLNINTVENHITAGLADIRHYLALSFD